MNIGSIELKRGSIRNNIITYNSANNGWTLVVHKENIRNSAGGTIPEKIEIKVWIDTPANILDEKEGD